MDGPLLLVAGGWIRVQGRVEGREVWRTPEGGGNVSGRERVRIAPIVLDAPDSEAARVFDALAGVLARKLAVLAETTPKIADANITWVSNPS